MQDVLTILKLAFPEHYRQNIRFVQGLNYLRVSPAIPSDLVFPKSGVGGRELRSLAALMTMPETAVHENRQSVLRKIDIRLAWQILPMQTESEAVLVQ